MRLTNAQLQVAVDNLRNDTRLLRNAIRLAKVRLEDGTQEEQAFNAGIVRELNKVLAETN